MKVLRKFLKIRQNSIGLFNPIKHYSIEKLKTFLASVAVFRRT